MDQAANVVQVLLASEAAIARVMPSKIELGIRWTASPVRSSPLAKRIVGVAPLHIRRTSQERIGRSEIVQCWICSPRYDLPGIVRLGMNCDGTPVRGNVMTVIGRCAPIRHLFELPTDIDSGPQSTRAYICVVLLLISLPIRAI